MSEWFEAIPDTATIELNGQPVPLREHPYVKESKDLPGFVSKAVNDYREIGNRIPIKIAKPEDAATWKKEHLPKIYKAGILEAPPEKPEDYGITKPEKLADGLMWNDELSKTFAATLHKHGATKALAGDLLSIYEQALTGMQTGFKTSYDEGLAAIKKEHGDKYDERFEAVKRMSGAIFKTPEEVALFEQLGLGDHPGFLSVMLRLAPLAMQDSSYLSEIGKETGGMSGEAVRAEVAKIMTDKTHPMYEGYWRNDPTVKAHIDELYKKAYGAGQVNVSDGITVGGRPPA